MKLRFVLLLLFINFNTFSNSIDSLNIVINNMFNAIDKLKSLKYVLRNIERIDGTLLIGEQYVKLLKLPRKCYILMLKPVQGAEVLYIEGKNNNLAIYNPNAFPYFKLNLDTYGSLMRKNNHHTIHEMGFDYIKSILHFLYTNDKNVFKYDGVKMIVGKAYYKITVTIPNYSNEIYCFDKNETVISVARKNKISEYKILELNPNIDDFSYGIEGKNILIPNFYAKKLELYIDKNNFMPIIQNIYDEKGLFEKYEYQKLEVNPIFFEKDFSSEYLGNNNPK
ncbi:MAG: hypothetical protein A2046_06910 [Bacteroidetes bacterium GWA2_30_7]|nr:MAG: hypothetical protein A2046_06910 [Bacteroidetes bacterium GWA2_30_7]